MVKIAIQGATGYTALELLKILLRHPGVEVTALTSRSEAGTPVGIYHPLLGGRLDLALADLTPTQAAQRADCIFSCLPHGVTSKSVPEMLAAGARVVDLSADYRLDDVASYEKWYGEPHHDGARLGHTVYGLPELFRSQIPAAQLVANPGCYPTSAILALAPFLKAELVDTRDIIVDSKSGVSGGGRTPKLGFHYPECNESISAYGVGKHRHTPEIEQILGRAVGRLPEVIFTPHLVPMDRGILTVTYSQLRGPLTEKEAINRLREFYAAERFVRVVDNLPGTKQVSGTNFCDITARIVRGRLLTISVLDNLIKGASGAAVQNFNLMFGFDETTGLL